MYTDYCFSQTIVEAHTAKLRQEAENRRTVRVAKGRAARRTPRG